MNAIFKDGPLLLIWYFRTGCTQKLKDAVLISLSLSLSSGDALNSRKFSPNTHTLGSVHLSLKQSLKIFFRKIYFLIKYKFRGNFLFIYRSLKRAILKMKIDEGAGSPLPRTCNPIPAHQYSESSYRFFLPPLFGNCSVGRHSQILCPSPWFRRRLGFAVDLSLPLSVA
jgi:hypothetical protein